MPRKSTTRKRSVSRRRRRRVKLDTVGTSAKDQMKRFRGLVSPDISRLKGSYGDNKY